MNPPCRSVLANHTIQLFVGGTKKELVLPKGQNFDKYMKNIARKLETYYTYESCFF